MKLKVKLTSQILNFFSILFFLFFGGKLYASPNDVSIKVETACFGDTTRFQDNSGTSEDQIANRHWYFGDGTDTWSLANPVHKYSTAGTYEVKLIVFYKDNTKDSAQISLTIHPTPEIDFDYSGDISFYEGNSITISETNNYSAYQWNTNETSSAITITESGKYTLKVTDINGCSNTATTDSIEVIKMTVERIEVKNNIITPNADGYNDYLEIEGLDAYLYPVSIVIFNVWGDVVYENSDYRNTYWYATKNGEQGGKIVDAGTYFYILKTSDKPDQTGSINVLR